MWRCSILRDGVLKILVSTSVYHFPFGVKHFLGPYGRFEWLGSNMDVNIDSHHQGVLVVLPSQPAK
jgi:hypothetical protein